VIGRALLLGALSCWGSLVLVADLGAQPEPVDLNVEPLQAEIGLFHHGVDLLVSAETEPEVEVAVLVTGPSSELVMRKTARLWGMLWAPAGEVTFESVPSLYLLRTTTDLPNLARAKVLEDLGIGYEALRAALGGAAEGELFQELIVLKESEGLFFVSAEGAEVSGLPEVGRQLTRVALRIPARAPATTYSIQLCGFRGGQLVARGEEEFELAKAGFAKLASSLAKEHGLAYGLFAVVAAVASGLLVGFLFGPGKKR